MTYGEIDKLIESVLGEIAFETLTAAYCTAVRDAIRAGLAAAGVKPDLLEVFHRFAELVVEVRADGRTVLRVIPVA